MRKKRTILGCWAQQPTPALVASFFSCHGAPRRVLWHPHCVLSRSSPYRSGEHVVLYTKRRQTEKPPEGKFFCSWPSGFSCQIISIKKKKLNINNKRTTFGAGTMAHPLPLLVVVYPLSCISCVDS